MELHEIEDLCKKKNRKGKNPDQVRKTGKTPKKNKPTLDSKSASKYHEVE